MQKSIRYAGFWVRALAILIDTFIIMVPVNYLLALYFGFDAFRGEEPNQTATAIQFAIVSVAFSLFWSTTGQTPGKKATQTRLVDSVTFETVSFPRAFFRFVLYFLSFITLIGFFIPVFRKDKKALHDLIARTCVIYDL
jgi:uncharacterized RDD family membrane protein YckC